MAAYTSCREVLLNESHINMSELFLYVKKIQQSQTLKVDEMCLKYLGRLKTKLAGKAAPS